MNAITNMVYAFKTNVKTNSPIVNMDFDIVSKPILGFGERVEVYCNILTLYFFIFLFYFHPFLQTLELNISSPFKKMHDIIVFTS